MRTSRPISTIWYGSEEFLKMKLDGLIISGDLTFYTYVKHLKEEDEKKDHIHVYMVPDGQLDTSSLNNELTEYDLTNVLPVRPLPYKFSKFDDWYLYDSHNVSYLASKGQTRKYHYSQSDFKSSNDDYLNELIHTIDLSKINRLEVVINAAEQGLSFTELVKTGQVPIQLFNQYKQAFELIKSSYAMTYRAKYENHENEDENEYDEKGYKIPTKEGDEIDTSDNNDDLPF